MFRDSLSPEGENEALDDRFDATRRGHRVPRDFCCLARGLLLGEDFDWNYDYNSKFNL